MYVKKAKNTFSYRWESEEFIALLGAKVSESIGYKQTKKMPPENTRIPTNSFFF